MKIGKSRKSSLWLGLVLLVGSMFVQPARVESQCMVAVTTTQMNSMLQIVSKTLSAMYQCTLTMSMNVMNCAPGTMGDNTSILTGSVTLPLPAMSPTCAWNCVGCGTVTIDGSDGLPVELLDFKVTALPKTPSPPEGLSKTDALVSRRP